MSVMKYLTEEKFDETLKRQSAEADKKLDEKLEEQFRLTQEAFMAEIDLLKQELSKNTGIVEKIFQMLDRDAKWRGDHEGDHATIHVRIDRVETYLGPGFRKTLSV